MTRVSLFPTCIVDAVTPEVGLAAARVLERTGAEVSVPDDATCCGQPAWNAGQVGPAAKVARTTLAALEAEEADVVVVPAGSCATMIRVFWPELFELVGDHEASGRAAALGAKVREFSEHLAAGSPLETGEVETRAAYHHSCHMLRELGIEAQPESLVGRCATEVVQSTARGRCCGFGGLFSVKLPELSTAMADDVLDAAVAAGAEELVAADGSCLLHLAGRADKRRLPLRFRHLAQLVDAATGDRDARP